jgi:multiple sugar transport system substrate-binding protein
MNKRTFAFFSFILALLVLAMPAFAQSEDEDASRYDGADPSGQNVVFWHQHSGEREEQLQEIVAEFNETNEFGITVEAQNQGGYGDIFALMTTTLAAGGDELPQLVVAYQNQAATYELVDGLINIDLLLNSEEWGLPEDAQADFFPGFFSADIFPIFGGQRLGFPPNRSMEVMYFNQDWLAELNEAGAISFEGAPATPEQFAEAACAAVENPFSGATGGADSVGYQISFDASRLASWTFAFGGDIFDYEEGVYDYNNEATVEAVAFLEDLAEQGCIGEIFERFGDQTNFGQGTTLFTVGSSSGLPFYGSAVEEGANFNWSVAPVPHITETPVQNIYGASVSIPKTTPEGEVAAWEFVKYYTSVETQAEWAQASNYFPVRQSVAEGLSDYFAENPAYETAFELLEFGQAEPPVPQYDPVRDEAELVFADIVLSDDDLDAEGVAEALEALEVFANEELTLAMEDMTMDE